MSARVGEAACWLPEPLAGTPPTLPGGGGGLATTPGGSGGAKTPRVCIGVAALNVRLCHACHGTHRPCQSTSHARHMHGTCMEQWSDGAAPATSLPTSDGIALKSGSWPLAVIEMSTHMRYEPPSLFAAQIHCSVQ